MNVVEEFSAKAAEAGQWSLAKVRDAARAAVMRRDRSLPHLAEIRNFEIPGAAGPLDARLYVPKGAPPRGPLLLFFHGGGFVFCDIDTHDALCTRLADAAGIRILSCSYRLAPEHPWPAQLEDAKAAARWIAANARRLGAQKRKLLIGGDSAGGYLALATAALMRRHFIGQVLIYPLMHLEDDVWARTMGANSRVIGRMAVRFIEAQLATGGARAPSLLNDGAVAPLPTLIARGGHLDPCAPDGAMLADHLKALGARVEERVYPLLLHGFANFTHSSAASRRAVEEIGVLAGELARG